jgi:hypothetical protein
MRWRCRKVFHSTRVESEAEEAGGSLSMVARRRGSDEVISLSEIRGVSPSVFLAQIGFHFPVSFTFYASFLPCCLPDALRKYV